MADSDIQRPSLGSPDALEQQRLALEFAKLRLERQRLGAELWLRRRDVRASSGKAWKEIFANPLILAIVGGFLTLMTTTIGNSINTSNTIAAEAAKSRQSLQADLIKKFVESPSRDTVRTNLSFLASVGLLPDYADRIRSYLADNPNSAPSASPAGLQAVRTDDDAIDLAISLEGGFSDIPTDPGGASKFGITLAQLQSYLGREASKAELRDLPLSTAREIYRKLFLQNVGSINSIMVKATYLGLAVNMGSNRAMQITQTAVGKVSGRSIPADGMLGPLTVALVNALDPDLLVETMACETARVYRSLPTFATLGVAQLRRVRTYLPANPKGLCPELLP